MEKKSMVLSKCKYLNNTLPKLVVVCFRANCRNPVVSVQQTRFTINQAYFNVLVINQLFKEMLRDESSTQYLGLAQKIARISDFVRVTSSKHNQPSCAVSPDGRKERNKLKVKFPLFRCFHKQYKIENFSQGEERF